jgi:hypothetical protein
MWDNASGGRVKVIIIKAHALNPKDKSKPTNEIKINATTPDDISAFIIHKSINIMVTTPGLFLEAAALK